MNTKTKIHPVVAALDVAKTQVALGAFLGITKQTVSYLLKSAAKDASYPTPAQHAVKIASLLGQRPADVRPDVFDPKWRVKRVSAKALA